MYYLVNNIKIFLARVAIFSLYAVFFMVHITTSSVISHTEYSNIVSVKTTVPSKEKVHTGKSETARKKNIRLNKRFHPESITSLEYSLKTPTTLFSDKFTLNKPEDYLLISSIIRDSLRGPPVVS